jgi:hypothetical protein
MGLRNRMVIAACVAKFCNPVENRSIKTQRQSAKEECRQNASLPDKSTMRHASFLSV